MRIIKYSIMMLGLCVFVHTTNGYTTDGASKLLSDLLTNYSSKVRPSSTTNVSLQFGMMHITELNIVTQTLHCVGFIVAMWLDKRLQWTPADYDDMPDAFIRVSDIWSPPLVLSNAANEIKVMNDASDLVSLNAYVTSSGYVVWLAPANYLSQCTINIQYYPFDSQSCHIVISSWMFLDYHISVTSLDTSINLDIYEDNGEWDITSSSVKNITRVLSGHHMPAVQFTLHLSRKYSYYLMNMLLPVVILAIMAPFVFLLPPASGEKIGYALTILLSLSVVMTLVSDNIPPTSHHTCLLSVYLLMTFIICSLETVLTVWTCRIHDMCGHHYNMGTTLMKLTRVLVSITRYRRPCEQEKLPKNVVSSINDVNITDNSEEMVTGKHSSWNKGSGTKEKRKSVDVILYSPEELTQVFDRFNFWVFLIITVIVTVVTMIILQVGGQS